MRAALRKKRAIFGKCAQTCGNIKKCAQNVCLYCEMHAQIKKCAHIYKNARKKTRKYLKMRAKCLSIFLKCVQQLQNARNVLKMHAKMRANIKKLRANFKKMCAKTNIIEKERINAFLLCSTVRAKARTHAPEDQNTQRGMFRITHVLVRKPLHLQKVINHILPLG